MLTKDVLIRYIQRFEHGLQLGNESKSKVSVVVFYFLSNLLFILGDFYLKIRKITEEIGLGSQYKDGLLVTF
ncbi:hypothetical protein AAW12_21130 [Sphingobacterium sp. Ag1]|nr:hypothetical protein AAW12_21130 [Sphingobacterium sp. Ag1]